MNKIDKKLSEILEVEVVDETQASVESKIISKEVIPAEDHLPTSIQNSDQDVQYDYEISRETHRGLLDQGQEALEGILKVAKESQHPRAYEVAAVMLKNMSDMTDKLMGLHEKKRILDAEKKAGNAGSTINIDKAVFTGSTTELLKQIKKQ